MTVKAQPKNMSLLATDKDLRSRKITNKLLRSITTEPLGSITFLDLSFLGLQRIGGLSSCPSIEIVNLHGNTIDLISDLSSCSHLWKLDLSCNELKSLSGFEKFSMLGTLVVSGNELEWQSLEKLVHLEIMSLYLDGNEKLSSCAHYRKHVIKCLPHIWNLDGEIVSAQERSSVDQFFKKSALSFKPVRMKLPGFYFIPTFIKSQSKAAVHGRRTNLAWKSFGRNEIHNKPLDERRLLYLCRNVHDDYNLESCFDGAQEDFISQLIEFKNEQVEKFNIFLLLLMASLIFSVPAKLMQSALEVINMNDTEQATCRGIFSYPLQMRTNVVSLMFSFVKLESARTGITAQLYNTLKELNSGLARIAYGNAEVLIEAKYHHVVATELVQVFCLVPTFLEFLNEKSVIKILTSATLNLNIDSDIRDYICKCDSFETRKTLAEFITLQVKNAKLRSQSIFDKTFFRKDSTDLKGTMQACQRLGMRPFSAPPVLRRNAFVDNHISSPTIGDQVLLSPQRLGRILSIPDKNVVLVQVDSMPQPRYIQADFIEHDANEQQSLIYVNKRDIVWNTQFSSWMLNESLSKIDMPARQSRQKLNWPSLTLQKKPAELYQGKRCSTSFTQNSMTSFNCISEEISSTSTLQGKRIIASANNADSRKDQISAENVQKHFVEVTGHTNVIEGRHRSNGEELRQHCRSVPLPLYLEPQETPGKYTTIRQGNMYHLFSGENTLSMMPPAKSFPTLNSDHSRRSQSILIKKSNWLQ